MGLDTAKTLTSQQFGTSSPIPAFAVSLWVF